MYQYAKNFMLGASTKDWAEFSYYTGIYRSRILDKGNIHDNHLCSKPVNNGSFIFHVLLEYLSLDSFLTHLSKYMFSSIYSKVNRIICTPLPHVYRR